MQCMSAVPDSLQAPPCHAGVWCRGLNLLVQQLCEGVPVAGASSAAPLALLFMQMHTAPAWEGGVAHSLGHPLHQAWGC